MEAMEVAIRVAVSHSFLSTGATCLQVSTYYLAGGVLVIPVISPSWMGGCQRRLSIVGSGVRGSI